MKNNIMIYGCLGILFACGGAAEENNGNSAISKQTSTELNINRGVTVDAKVDVHYSDETSGISFEEFEEEREEANREVQDTNISEDQSETTRKESSAVAEKLLPAKKMESAVAKKNLQSEEREKEPQMILISIVPDLMKFDKETFTVIAGQKVIIELDNLDGMQHNLIITKPGTLKKVGAAADALARDPQGAQKNYVPEMPEVLFATELLKPDEVVTFTFTAPSEPGDYPFVCTFPGHWRMMNGVMKVTK